jgi:hypothetical protein
MRKNLYAGSNIMLGLITLLIAALPFRSTIHDEVEKQERIQAKASYAEWFNNHPYAPGNGLTASEAEEMPKYDRPDLAQQQNFLWTLDPALGYPPIERLNDALRIVEEFKTDPSRYAPGDVTLPWEERGPDNVGGRTRTMMWDPNTTNKLWAGSVGGGLWYNNDITTTGTSWTSVDDTWANLAVTCMDYDPSNTQVFYIGTGEGWYNADAIRGLGIWKSTNGGTSWSQLASTNNSTFYQIQDLVVHPTTGDIYVATRGDGVQRSQDGGLTWAAVLNSSTSNANTNRAADLEIGADNTIYASMGIFSEGDIFRSTTGNSGGWTHLSAAGNGIPTAGLNRIELATAPSNANVIYAITSSGSVLTGIYSSGDQGTNWTSESLPNDADVGISAVDFTRGQAWYDLIAQVDPNDADHLYVGGVDLFHSFDGGAIWQQVSHWYGGYGFTEVHADQHAIAFKPGSSTEVVFGNDGGVAYSANATAATPAFTIHNNDYNVTQYYACAIHPTAGTDWYLAGAQDNGTQRYNAAGINSTSEVTGGDGCFTHIDQTDPTYQLTSYVYNNYYRSVNNGATFGGIASENTGFFVNPTDYDDNEDILFGSRTGSTLRRLSGISGTIVAANITIPSLSGTSTAISVSPHTLGSTTLFLGTGAGQILKVTTADGTPASTNADPSNALPGGTISCIEIGASESELLVTFGNFGVNSVYYTSNGGASWTSKEGNLPDMPVRWALFNPDDYNEVILATEVGVWSTADISVGSPSWVPSNSGLANVRVDMLQMRTSDNEVAAATHGRGLFTGIFFNPEFTLDAVYVQAISPIGLQCSSPYSIEVEIKNNGSVALTTLDIDWDINGGTTATFNWVGSLAPGYSTTVVLASNTTAGGAHTLNVALSNPNGGTDENLLNDTGAQAFSTLSTPNTITLTLTTDCWENETSWDIVDGSSNVVASGSGYGDQSTNLIDVCLNDGCYTLNVYDSYGDGLSGSNCGQVGDFFLSDASSNLLAQITTIAFGFSESHAFCIPFPSTTYYSVATGDMTGAIWDVNPAGTGGLLTPNCTTNLIVQNTHVVTNNIGNFNVLNFDVETGGTFNLGTGSTMSLCGNLLTDGTFSPSDSKVSFEGNAPQTLGGTTNTTFFDVRLDNASGLQLMSDQTINGGLDLQNGDFDVNGNVWTFAANSTSTGRLLEIQATADFVGEAVAQNYLGSAQAGWRMMGTVVNGSTVSNQWNDDLTTTGFLGSDFPDYDFVNVRYYDETLIGTQALYDSGFFAPVDINNAVSALEGCFIYMAGLPLTLGNNGSPVKGAVSIPVSHTNSSTVAFNDGWALVANSYQSTIDWDATAGWSRTNIDGTIYAWDNDLQQWASYTGGGVGVNGGSRYIAPQQGYWIKTNALGAVFGMDEAVKADEYVAFIRETEDFYDQTITLTVSGSGINDQFALAVRPGATDDFDHAYDGYKFRSYNDEAPSLYSVVSSGNEESELSIHAVGELISNNPIPLHLEVALDGEYMITASDFAAEAIGACLTLEDLLTGNTVALESGMNYSFEASGADDSHRFNITTSTALTVQETNATCSGNADGIATASANGVGPYNYYWYDSGDLLLASDLNVSGSSSLQGLGTGSYTVAIEDLDGQCASIVKSFNIDQPAQLALETISFTAASCNIESDGTIKLNTTTDCQVQIIQNGTEIDSYAFAGGLLEIDNLEAGEYEVIVSNACGNEHMFFDLYDSDIVEASFDGPLVVDLSTGEAVQFTNTSTNALDYVWYLTSDIILFGTENPSFNYTEEGTYEVILYADNGRCFDTASLEIEVVGTVVDLEEITLNEDSYLIYTAGDQLIIQSGHDLSENARIEISTLEGKLVQAKTLNGLGGLRAEIALDQLSQGVYHVTLIENGSRTITQKIFLD